MRYIKNLIPLLNIVGILSTLFVVMWFSGCTTSDDQTLNPKDNGSGFSFTLEVPNIGIPKDPSSRSMEGVGMYSKEDEVRTVDVLVFDESTKKFLEHVVATDVAQNLTVSTTVSFKAKLTATSTPVCIVVVANKEVLSSGFDESTTKKQVLDALTVSSDENWPANGSGTYTRIPMYGETMVSKIDPTVTIPAIPLTRMLARIDIKNSTSNFTVEAAYLVNYNTVGYIPPKSDASGTITGNDINIPSNPGKRTGRWLTYNVSGSNNYAGEIYTFEAPAAVDVPGNDLAPSRKDATCIIIKGRIGNGVATYYRIDFLRSGTNDYIALKRNYKYIIDIRQANAQGYALMEEAIASYRTMTNLSVRIISYGSEEKITNVVYNGQYMLGLGETDVNLRQYQINNYNVNVYTDYPGGWDATITSGEQWLSFRNGTNHMEGNANQDQVLSFDIPYFGEPIGSSRTAVVTVTAGRLTHKVEVVQSVEEPGMLRFMDAYGNVLENGLYFPMVEETLDGQNLDPTPQVVYVMWTTHKVKAWRQDRTLGTGSQSTRFVEYVSPITPDIPAANEGSVFLNSGVQAITVSPSKEETSGIWWRWDAIYFQMLDQAGAIVAQKEFPINQGFLEFKIDNFPKVNNNYTYELELGPIHTLELVSNVNWEITKVEEIGATGLLDPANDVLKGGTSNMVRTINTPNVTKTIENVWTWGIDGTDIVAGTGKFNLRVPTGDWVPGKEGIVRVTFKNLSHTKGGNEIQDDYQQYKKGDSDDDYFPFYKTIDLVVKGPTNPGMSYAANTQNARFWVNPKRYTFINESSQVASAYMNYADAERMCMERGKNWRLPNLSEALLSSIYAENVGGLGADNPSGWYEYTQYWTSTTNNNSETYTVMLQGNGGTDKYTDLTQSYASVRCVLTQTASGTKYPFVKAYNSGGDVGTMIVSRDANGGVADNDAIFLKSGETITPTVDKIAPMLLVANENTPLSNNETYADAVNACKGRGTGWRLPTLREAMLMVSVGMTGDENTLQNSGFNAYDLPVGFKKMIGNKNGVEPHNPYWTQTQMDENSMYTLWGNSTSFRGKTDEWWAVARCVKSFF